MDTTTIIREEIGKERIQRAIQRMEEVAKEKEWQLQQHYRDLDPEIYAQINWEKYLPKEYFHLQTLLQELDEKPAH